MSPREHALRWRGRERWVMLATLFDAAAFLGLWRHWRDDPQRCGALHVIAIDATPPTCIHLAALPDDALTKALVDAWPPLTPDLHTLGFDDGRVQLQLAVGEPARWLREIVAQVDAFEVGATTDWRALARLAAPGASLVTGALDVRAQRALMATGFVIDAASASATHAMYAPVHVARHRRVPTVPANERRALVVGAGLAGCAAAWALAERGWRSTVFDTHATPAGGASGNPAGLFHAVVHASDGVHARLLRSAALHASAEVAIALREHGVAGSVSGLLRNETRLDIAAMRALLERLRLPADAVRAVDADEAQALCGLRRPGPAWFYPGGGWVDPAALARSYLARAGTACRFVGATRVARICRLGARWQLLDEDDRPIDEAGTIVLANAGDAAPLAGIDEAMMEPVRGQLSWFDAPTGSDAAWPLIPIAGPGHAVKIADGRIVFGATQQRNDPDPALRSADHADNLAQLAGLLGRPVTIDAATLHGRVGWRWTTRDRLPLIGALASANGLFVFCGLGSRGIAWSALGGRVLAAAIGGGPAPLPAGLLKAVAPDRFAQRALRRRAVP